jgi:hypothetical protein
MWAPPANSPARKDLERTPPELGGRRDLRRAPAVGKENSNAFLLDHGSPGTARGRLGAAVGVRWDPLSVYGAAEMRL